MKHLIYSSILFCQIIIVASKAINSNSTNTEELELQIQALEKEKDDLFDKLNVAINESVVALKRVNDSDSDDGVQYLTELRKEIQELNEADSVEESDERNVTSLENGTNELNVTNFEFRRKGKGKKKHKKREDYSEDKGDARSLSLKIMNIKKKHKKELAFLHTSQHLKVEQDLRDWLAKKQEEKRKIQEYRLKQKLEDSHYESCPRTGSKKKKTMKKQKKKGVRFLPCCRKCCKKSYMGCL